MNVEAEHMRRHLVLAWLVDLLAIAAVITALIAVAVTMLP